MDARPSGSCRSFRLGTNRNLSSVVGYGSA
nr:MAG TPA: hypothetical protein [Caudoviricetes sp.]